ncbi:hypothetical protein G5B10_11765 [Fluviicola sp. SGL-29]|nr:hypothetical protein [Fluviicola sp. SGL-29]
MKNKRLASIGECVLPLISLLRIKQEFDLTNKELKLLRNLTFTDEGDVLLKPSFPYTGIKTIRLGLIETGLYDYIIGCKMYKNVGIQIPEVDEKVEMAHSMLRKFLGDNYSLISFEVIE